jgi:predicted permease
VSWIARIKSASRPWWQGGSADSEWPSASSALEGVWLDLRLAWRGLLGNPVFALTAIVSLSLAIGSNTAIYSVVDAAMLRPLAVPQPERLITLATPEIDNLGTPASGVRDTFSYPLYEQLKTAAGEMARFALFDTPNRVELQVAGPDEAIIEDVIGQLVSADAFDILGVAPGLGALFSTAEDHFPSPRSVVVLSHEYWRRRFNADSAVLGRNLIVNGKAYAILGVARDGFYGAEPGKFVDVWMPIRMTDPGIFTNPGFHPFHLLGRLAPGTTREQVAARLQPTFHNHQEARISAEATMPLALQQHLRQMKILVQSGANGTSAFRQAFSRPLWILVGVAASILLVACANVASLLLARSTQRSGEMALRISLGAGRARLVRQLLTESLSISLVAGACGWAAARSAAPALVAMVSKRADPVRLDLALDTRVLVFCAAICACSTLLFGLLPAWQATSARPMLVLRRMNAHGTALRVGRLLVGVQVAFTFCLVTSGAGFLFSLRNLAAVDPGFDRTGVAVLTVLNTPQRDRQLASMQQLQTRAAALPNVQGAATAWMALFSGGRRADRVLVAGRPPSQREETFYRVSPGYFETLRTTLLSGRDFTFRDNDNEPVPTVVNRTFAIRYFGTESVLGSEFSRDDGVRHQIIGLADDSHFGALQSGPEAIAYMPMKPPHAFTLYVHSTLDARSIASMVEREAQALGSGLRVRDVTTLETLVGNTILNEKLLATIGGAFAFVGLLLTAIGLFGLLSYSVARRTREIGIRVALGAQRLQLYRLVAKDATGMIVGGMTLGLAGSLAVMRVCRSLLFGIQAVDPAVIGTAILLFIGTAVLAGGLPARRAAAIDPVRALRSE